MYLVTNGVLQFACQEKVQCDAFINEGWQLVDTDKTVVVEEEKSEAYSEEQLSAMKVNDLKQLAKDLGIELTATKKADIVKEIMNSQG